MTSTSCFGDRVDVELGQRVAQRLLARDVGAEPRLEQAARRLAGTEPRDPDLARELAERGVDRPLELVGRHRDVELDLVALDRLDGCLERGLDLGGRGGGHGEVRVYPGPSRCPAPWAGPHPGRAREAGRAPGAGLPARSPLDGPTPGPERPPARGD